MKMRKRNIVLLVVCLGILFILFWTIWNNDRVVVTNITITDSEIPMEFSGFKIAQVSDLHNRALEGDNKNLIKKLKETDCDIIVMTGDMIDSRNTDIDVSLDFISKCVEIAPCYYVTGNHEARVKDDYEIFKLGLCKLGVNVLENKYVDITKGEKSITIIGLHDTGFDLSTGIDYLLESTMPHNDNYKILLAHRPEYFDKYNNVNLIFSGHAHGGQIRIPFVGGVFSPGQGFFPKYTQGKYEENGKCMIVSRGTGNSLFPLRINNNPEIVVVTLQKEE